MQDPKYEFLAGAVRNRHTGEIIPEDEPVFLFRARDARAAKALYRYYEDLPPGEHELAVLGRYEDFRQFAENHPERMKEPDTDAGRAALEKGS